MTLRTDKMSAVNSRAAYMSTGNVSGEKIIVIIYPNEHSYMPNDSMNIGKVVQTYLLNTCVFKINPGNQGSSVIFSVIVMVATFR
jgi:hypothetical protein